MRTEVVNVKSKKADLGDTEYQFAETPNDLLEIYTEEELLDLVNKLTKKKATDTFRKARAETEKITDAKISAFLLSPECTDEKKESLRLAIINNDKNTLQTILGITKSTEEDEEEGEEEEGEEEEGEEEEGEEEEGEE